MKVERRGESEAGADGEEGRGGTNQEHKIKEILSGPGEVREEDNYIIWACTKRHREATLS